MLLLTFIALQIMDLLTTVAFLRGGGSEANPLIRLALAGSASPGLALVLPKLLAVALAGYAWSTGRKRILLKMDVLFGAFVAWNLMVIFLQR